jgi:hypothetical protein
MLVKGITGKLLLKEFSVKNNFRFLVYKVKSCCGSDSGLLLDISSLALVIQIL